MEFGSSASTESCRFSSGSQKEKARIFSDSGFPVAGARFKNDRINANPHLKAESDDVDGI